MSLKNAIGVVLGGDILHKGNVFRPVRGQWALCFVGITIRKFGSQLINLFVVSRGGKELWKGATPHAWQEKGKNNNNNKIK